METIHLLTGILGFLVVIVSFFFGGFVFLDFLFSRRKGDPFDLPKGSMGNDESTTPTPGLVLFGHQDRGPYALEVGTMTRRLWALLGVLVFMGLAIVITLVIFFRNAEGNTPNTLMIEVSKALLQLGVVSVLGVFVSLFTFEYQRRRQLDDQRVELQRMNLAYREDLLKTTLARTMTAYSKVKKARRLLRARAIEDSQNGEHAQDGGLVPTGATGSVDTNTIVLSTEYDSYMDMVNDAELDLENLGRDIETSKDAFPDWKSLRDHVDIMNTYLTNLIEEYEINRRKFEGPEHSNPTLSELPKLKDFIAPAEKSKFDRQVRIPFHKVQARIRAALLHPQLVSGPS